MKKSTFVRNGNVITRSRNERGQFTRGYIEIMCIQTLINQLQAIARKVLDNTQELVAYESKLGNLVDSTACAVYYDGELVEDTIEYATPTATSFVPSKKKKQDYAVNSGMTGRDAIDRWFSENRILPSKQKNVVSLVAIAAMHYGYYLENGLYHDDAPKIKVISGIMDEIEQELAGISSKAGYKAFLIDIAGVGKIKD